MNNEKNTFNLDSFYNDMVYLSKSKINELSMNIINSIKYYHSIGVSYDFLLNYIYAMNLNEEKLRCDEECFLRRDAVKSLNRIYRKEEK